MLRAPFSKSRDEELIHQRNGEKCQKKGVRRMPTQVSVSKWISKYVKFESAVEGRKWKTMLKVLGTT